MSQQDHKNNDIQLLREKIKDVRFAMLTTAEADGTLRSRPMATQNSSDVSDDLLFFTYADSPKVDDVEQHRQVNLSYSEPKENLFVSVTGTAQLLRDRALIKKLWNPMMKAWFPNGEDDPNLALLQVHVSNAEIWDAPSGKMGGLFATLKGLATKGEDPGGNDIKLNMQ